MRASSRRASTALAAVALTLSAALAFAPNQVPQRFDAKARPQPGAVIAIAPVATDRLPSGDGLRAGWERFALEQGGGWAAYVDERSGLPALVFGRGIAWVPAGATSPPSLAQLEAAARALVAEYPDLLGRHGAQMQVDAAASGRLGDHVWQVSFRQVVDGVPVRGARYDFQVNSGNLVAFGATRWAPVRAATAPALSRGQARAALDEYLGVTASGEVVDREPGTLELIPLAAGAATDAAAATTAYAGARGAGYEHRLVWRFVFEVPGESATWVAEVDAHTGAVLALFDDTRYGRVKGGVFPLSSDGIGPEGTEQPGFPMPFADVGAQQGNDAGVYTCSGSGTVTTTLAGPYIRVSDKCGSISESGTCPADVDLGASPGTDCAVPPGDSAGNTHAARSSFYHLNRVMEKGRAWLPENTWLQSQVIDNVNITQTCNAYWNGSVNFFRSGGGCRNTGELAGVFVHEWGHGLDANDGGGYDNPSEAYADIVAFFEARESCVGRGFFMSGNCGGYGDACLDCTGIRDQDWDKHARHTPATPQNFLATNCGGGGGPCGREEHCESYVAGQAVYDLATRDLPAMGVDAASSWQLAEKLFYQTRAGGGGNAYNCALPSADGCGTNSWFHKMRVADDNNGNLDDGTPHAAAIYAAFARHGIACGQVADPANRNSSGCVPMAKPAVTVEPSDGQVRLRWNAVTGASKYLVLRNDTGCSRGQVIVDAVAAPGTTYTDTAVGNGFTVYYRVQAQGSKTACESPVSDCVAATTPAPAGTVGFDRDAARCSATLGLRVLDGNTGGSTLTVKVSSLTEPEPEIVTLVEISPGAGNFSGTIATSGVPPAHGDGVVSTANGDTLTVEYVDANDGAGGTNVIRRDTAAVDCAAPVIANVRAEDVTDGSAVLAWETDEPADTGAAWGTTKPPQGVRTGDGLGTAHRLPLTGLAACSLYYYDARSADPAGNAALSNNGGAYFQFQTLGDFGSGPEVCRRGTVTIDEAGPACSATLRFGVADVDLDADPAASETSLARVSSTSEPEPETVVLTEVGTHSLRFAGSIVLAPAPAGGGAPPRDGRLQVRHGDVITVAYYDAGDGHGGSGWRSATTVADCRGPSVTAVGVDTLTNARGTIRFTTAEPGDTHVEWGTTPALGQVAHDPQLVTEHALALNQFDACQKVYFRVRSTDAAGNAAAADDNGAPFAFGTFTIPGLYWKDGFERSTPGGWTLQGEWEIGPPQGKGGTTQGFPDPPAAYNNGSVLGQDLTGRGAAPGDYEKGSNDRAISPPQNGTTWKNTQLVVHRQLNAGLGDEAGIYLCVNGPCYTIYRSALTAVFDDGWSRQEYDVSGLADGKSGIRIEFRQGALGGTGAGWTVDDVMLKNGALPDYGACGGCGQAPSFAGATGAADDDACAAGGVTVRWAPAVAWGTGTTGTYAVYRGPAPGFPADAAHRIASGVTALAYTDAGAPAGTSYYLVRAENDETCSSGPKNGGVTDANAAYVAVEQTATRPVPAEVTGLTTTLANHAHVRLQWNAAAGATAFHVKRATSPAPGAFATLATTASTLFEDLDQASDRTTRFYLVRGVNACDQEGP